MKCPATQIWPHTPRVHSNLTAKDERNRQAIVQIYPGFVPVVNLGKDSVEGQGSSP